MLRFVDAMIKIAEHRCAAEIKRMARVPKLTEAQAAWPLQHCKHDAVASEIRSVIAPRHDHLLRLGDQPAKPPIIARTHRVTRATRLGATNSGTGHRTRSQRSGARSNLRANPTEDETAGRRADG
jgi:hypothetical protein